MNELLEHYHAMMDDINRAERSTLLEHVPTSTLNDIIVLGNRYAKMRCYANSTFHELTGANR